MFASVSCNPLWKDVGGVCYMERKMIVVFTIGLSTVCQQLFSRSRFCFRGICKVSLINLLLIKF